ADLGLNLFGREFASDPGVAGVLTQSRLQNVIDRNAEAGSRFRSDEQRTTLDADDFEFFHRALLSGPGSHECIANPGNIPGAPRVVSHAEGARRRQDFEGFAIPLPIMQTDAAERAPTARESRDG